MLAKSNYFADVGLWPKHSVLDPEGWLGNFTPNESDHAVHLLNTFQYFCGDMLDAMFVATVQSLSTLDAVFDPVRQSPSDWTRLMDSTIFTHVQGETPSVTDSGFLFARRARQLLGVPAEHILSPDDALALLYQLPPPLVVFLDDLLGTGGQFVSTWHVQRDNGRGQSASFSSAALALPSTRFFYCPLFATIDGVNRVENHCVPVQVHPCHKLELRDSVLSPLCPHWPKSLSPAPRDVIHDASIRAGIPESAWRGVGDFGYALAFEHGTPDETLPIFTWNKGGWRPLVHR